MIRNLSIFFTDEEEIHFVWFIIDYENNKNVESNLHLKLNELNVKIKYAYLETLNNEHREYVLLTKIEDYGYIETVVNELQAIPHVTQVKSRVSKNTMIHNIDFPLNFLGERAVIVRSKAFVHILKIISKNMIQPKGLLMVAGVKGGQDIAKYIKNIIKMDNTNTFEILRELFISSGWGEIEFEIDKNTYIGEIRVINSFIADEVGLRDLPVCSYISGFISGYLTDTLGETIQVREIQCSSMGYEYCVHMISPAPKTSNIEHIMKEGML